jgi:hypothetical protein
MRALPIRDDISPEELRRRTRQEGDGRVAARLFAIANAQKGMDHASEAIIDTCCEAWNWLLAETGRIRSLRSYPWLKQVSS